MFGYALTSLQVNDLYYGCDSVCSAGQVMTDCGCTSNFTLPFPNPRANAAMGSRCSTNSTHAAFVLGPLRPDLPGSCMQAKRAGVTNLAGNTGDGTYWIDRNANPLGSLTTRGLHLSFWLMLLV